MNRVQVNKWKKTLIGALENLAEKKEEHIDEVLKMQAMWT
jgi:hypothetical protein